MPKSAMASPARRSNFVWILLALFIFNPSECHEL
jgi:hypothetical protein